MSLSIKLFDKGYLGTRLGIEDDPLPLGHITPYGTDAVSKKRMVQIDDWSPTDNPPVTFDNSPLYGFKLAKSTSDYVMHENTVLIEDPRGFEMEISILNFSQIVKQGIIVRGEIKSECVWAVDGNMLMLLTTDSDLYKKARENTDRYTASVNTRSVKPGNKILLQNGKIATYYGQVYRVEKESRTVFDTDDSSYNWRSRVTKGSQEYYFNIGTKKKHFLIYEDGKHELLSVLKTSSVLDNQVLSSAEVQEQLFKLRMTNYSNDESFKFCFTVDKAPKVFLDMVKSDFDSMFAAQASNNAVYRNATFFIKNKQGQESLVKGTDIKTALQMKANNHAKPTIEGVLFSDIEQLKTGKFSVKRENYYNLLQDPCVIRFGVDDIDEIYEIQVNIESAGIKTTKVF